MRLSASLLVSRSDFECMRLFFLCRLSVGRVVVCGGPWLAFLAFHGLLAIAYELVHRFLKAFSGGKLPIIVSILDLRAALGTLEHIKAMPGSTFVIA